MGIIKGLFSLVDDIISIPTDLIGLTNHHKRKEIKRILDRAFIEDKISSEDYEKAKTLLDNLK